MDNAGHRQQQADTRILLGDAVEMRLRDLDLLLEEAEVTSTARPPVVLATVVERPTFSQRS